MFCEKCGVEVQDNAKFCNACGNKMNSEKGKMTQEGGSANNTSNNANLNQYIEKAKKIPRKAWIGIGTVLVAIIVCFVFVKNYQPTIDLNEYVIISYEGYDGYGTADVSVDWDAIEDKYGTEIKFTPEAMEEYGGVSLQMSITDMMSYYIGWNIDSRSGLTNGDEITNTWYVDEETLQSYLNCKFKYTDSTYTVSELTEVKTFDPFEGIEVTFSGISPNGTMNITSTDNVLPASYYGCSKPYELKNGDVVVVQLSTDDTKYYIDLVGAAPSITEKEYIVEGLDSYAVSSLELNQESVDTIKTQVADIITAYIAGLDTAVTVGSSTYLGDYFLAAKTDTVYSRNIYGMVYRNEYNIQVPEGEDPVNVVQYISVQYSDIIAKVDGTNEVDLENYQYPTVQFQKTARGIRHTFTYYEQYVFYGCETLEELKRAQIEVNLENYTYEWNVEE